MPDAAHWLCLQRSDERVGSLRLRSVPRQTEGYRALLRVFGGLHGYLGGFGARRCLARFRATLTSRFIRSLMSVTPSRNLAQYSRLHPSSLRSRRRVFWSTALLSVLRPAR